MKNKNCINVSCYEKKIDLSCSHIKSKIKNSMNLLIIPDKIKSHYVCIKYFNKLMFNEVKNKNKKHFCKYCLQCFSSKKILV